MSMHMYTGSKGDPLCPLGFHPQVRWPTRCKRCFRDYKEHGGKGGKDADTPSIRKDDTTMSTPSLSSWSSSKAKEEIRTSSFDSATPTSSPSSSSNEEPKTTSRFSGRPSSWTSTPDLSEADAPTVSVTLPRRRLTADLSSNLDAATRSTEFTVRRRTSTSSGDLTRLDDSISLTTTIKPRNTSPFVSKTAPKEESPTKAPAKTKVSSSTNTTENLVKKPVENKKLPVVSQNSSKPPGKTKKEEKKEDTPKSSDVEFIFKVKSSSDDSTKKHQVVRQTSSVLIPPHGSSSSSSSDTEQSSAEDDDDKTSIAGTETTETTLVNASENLMQEEIESLKTELETVKTRCEKAEREKSDLLLRRLASYDTTPTKHTASEVLKLQQKVNEMTTQLEDLRDEKKSLSLKVRELETDLDQKNRADEKGRRADELQGKLTAAETLCEELMDENEDIKKELRELEDEIEEMRDNFREDQAEEYSGLRKELQQTTKNCRILSFKLRKSERRTEELETEKLELERRYKEAVGGQKGVDNMERLKKMEADLNVANEVATRLTKELEEAKAKLKSKDSKEDSSKKKSPLLGIIPKSPSGEKMSRASLTRGGSQEDPQQLLRDLQDSMEREADLREQLKFAEEEAANLRKKATRVDEENDSLALQLKKMATKAKSGRRRSPTPNRLTPEPFVEKDEGISEEEDPAELRLMLELNEQETGVLRKKVEELESELDAKKRKLKEVEEKLNQKPGKKAFGVDSIGKEPSPLEKEKMKVIEEECGELRKKLIEKERENERLQNEVQMNQRKKGTLVKSKSLDSGNEQQALDLKRHLQLVEQEATVLRTKTQTLETENEKLSAENRKLQLLRGTKKLSNSSESLGENDKISSLETKLADSQKMIKELKEKLEKAETAVAKKSPVSSAFGKSTELEKVKKDLKAKTEEAEKLTKEVDLAKEALRRLRDDATADILSFYKARSPKRPTDMTTKLQMKKMVDELENEIGDILIALQKSSTESNKESFDDSIIKEKDNKIKELDEKLRAAEAQKTEKADKEKEKVEKSLAEEREKLKKLETDRKAMESEKKKLTSELQKLQKERDTWLVEKKNLENKIEELNNEKKNSVLAQDEVAVFMKKLDNLTKDLEKERETVSKLKEQLASVNKLEEEKSKLQKEVTDRNKQILDFDRKVKDGEEKLKRLEKTLATGKSRITKLEKTLEDQETVRVEREERWKGLQEDLAGQEVLNQSLKSKIAELEDAVEKKNDSIKGLEDSLRKERERASDASMKAGSAEKREMTSLREELSQKMKELEEANSKCEELEKKRKNAEECLKKEQADMKKEQGELKKESESTSKKLVDLEVDLNAEKKKCEKMKSTHEKELKNREMELTTLKVKIKTLEQSQGDSSKLVTQVREELNTKYKKLEAQLSRERQEYEDLTVKYELLEEEHVVTKAQMVMEKEKIQNQLVIAKREGESLASELSTLRETYSSKQDAWIKEKIDLQEELKENIERLTRNSESKWELEKSRLISMHDEQLSIADGLKTRNEAMEEQMDHMRKENEEMRKKLVDFEKVEKVQRQLTQESDRLEAELKEVRTKLGGEEKNHKAELAAQKLRYESRVNLISEELQSSQSQLSRFKRERDAYRHMLEEAQTQMADLKSGKRKDSRPSSTSGDEEEAKETIAALEQQLSVMEDELSEARLEASKLKTELVSEKSAWEVKVSELQSKVNALEEDKILSSGRTKIPGLRTRMELAWAKEREDQTRLLQETSTLARDLRQTLFEVERERDKERLEAKRRHDQIKKTSEEELDENRKKITELQCDLLELRDAHAKLRTTNEKLRREREKGDRELRAQMRARRTDDEERKLNGVMDQIENFMRQLPDVLEEKAPYLDLPPGFRLRSREPSPANPNEDKAKMLQLTLQRLHQAVVEMRTTREADDRSRRSVSIGFGNRRAGSTEPESENNNGTNRVQRKPSLYRKSLSLSETAGPAASDQAIWKDEQDGSINSLQSLDDHVNNRLQNMGKRESSMDSRLSGGSTQSEMIGEQKKKKGLFGKLKKLTKSKSEDTGSQEDFRAYKSTGGSDSDMSALGDGDTKGSKSDLKGKLSGIFSKKGTSSRGNSVERTLKPEDGSKSLPRSTKSPAKSVPEKSSTLGRTFDKAKNPTAGMYRK